jgi:hypothetical protein
MDSGLFLGFIQGESLPLCLGSETVIPVSMTEQLREKRTRYEKMLILAVRSVEIAAETGSPFHEAAVTILLNAEAGIDNSRIIHCCASLGHLSYGYGWLDAGIRAGLFRILDHPELFTTETCCEL